MPNLDWYFYKDENNRQTNDMIQCIFTNCPHKNKPICFMSWIPSNKPHVIHKYKVIQKKEYYADRAYIMAVCDLHYHKFIKDESKVMDFMTDVILPLRKYEDKNGFVVLPDMVKQSEQIKEAFTNVSDSANKAQEQFKKVMIENLKEMNLDNESTDKEDNNK